MIIKPTSKAIIFFAASIPVALVIIAGWRELWYLALYLPGAALALIAAEAVMIMPKNNLQITFKSPPQLFVGQTGAAQLTLKFLQKNRSVVVQSLLEISGDAAPTKPATRLLKDETTDIELEITPSRRGRLTVKALWLRWRGPLGLLELQFREPQEHEIDVVPNIHGVQQDALRFFSTDSFYGQKTQRLKGEGGEFDNLCEYAPGMDTRFIDWKRSAHHRKLLCKEFRQERNHHLVFGFDTGYLMLEPINQIPKLDHAIQAGLLLSWVSLKSGDLVGGCAFDSHFNGFLKPGRGMPYFSQFQKFASGLSYETEETNFTLGLAELNSKLKRRSLVVLFTEFVDAISAELLIESLQLLTRRHLVIFVTLRDPMLLQLQNALPYHFSNIAESVLASDFLRERAIVLERVARLGVQCLDVFAQNLSTSLLNRYLMIKQRGLL